MTIKTLDELIGIDSTDDSLMGDYIFRDDIKEEAIKFLKFYMKMSGGGWTIKDFIGWFFNITEEDLE